MAHTQDQPELLVPAGSPQKLQVALSWGADAVYVGAAGLSMRPDQASFTISELKRAVEQCHAAHRRLYVAINTLAFEHDLQAVEQWLRATESFGFDALIVSDPGIFRLARQIQPQTDLHISTQLSTANSQAVGFWQDMGATRVILARECTLAMTRQIATASSIGLEMFVHGAMCVAISGRCLLSAHLAGTSASRGECKHSCRWQWQLVEAKRPGETIPIFEEDGKTFFMGSRDLCLIEHAGQLVDAGACAWKIEGRMKGEYYLALTTACWRAARDLAVADPANYHCNPKWLSLLNAISHRPYGPGFAFGYDPERAEDWQTHNQVIGTSQVLGIVTCSDQTRCRVQVKYPIQIGQMIDWIGPGMTEGKLQVADIRDAEGSREQAHCGTIVELIPESSDSLPPTWAMLHTDRPASNG